MIVLLLFIVIPIIEIALFIKVGGEIGVWPTLAIIITTAIIGTTLLRSQGLSTLSNLQNSMQTGKNPLNPMAHGALILVSGILLITPGFFTDATGLILLIPAVRDKIITHIIARMNIHMMPQQESHDPFNQRSASNSEVLEAEYEVIDETPSDSTGDSGWTKH